MVDHRERAEECRRLANLRAGSEHWAAFLEMAETWEQFGKLQELSRTAVKWRNWKMHLIKQDSMYDVPQTLALPKIVNLLTDLKEERDVAAYNTWVADPMLKIIGDFEVSLKKYPPIKLGTPDPYTPSQ